MTCGEFWIKVNVNHLLFFIHTPPGNAPRWLYVPAGIFHFSLFVSLLSFCLSSTILLTYTAPHANCIPQANCSPHAKSIFDQASGIWLFFIHPIDSLGFTSHLLSPFLGHQRSVLYTTTLLHFLLFLYKRPVKSRRGKSLLFLRDKNHMECWLQPKPLSL